MSEMHEVPALPELPDLDELVAIARQRRDHFSAVMMNAKAEVDGANALLVRLSNRSRGNRAPQRLADRGCAPETYRAVLTALGNHSYAGAATLAGTSGFSRSQVYVAMHSAVERGHAEREKRGRKLRWTITEAGTEFVTADPS